MLRRILFGAVTAVTATANAVSLANDPKVVISIEKSKTDNVETTKPPFAGHRPTVDVAILLDTSNSMDGLIDQTKKQLWTIVQQFAKAKKHGKTPELRVALFEYGNSNLPASEGYIRQVVPLTDDLDKLSESLFSLKTCGGDEYCGQVIGEAVKRLDWSKEPNGYKTIFIAGNEPFTQGTVDFHETCKRAIEKGIVVNTIHCGTREEGIQGGWQEGAKLAEGQFLNIDQDRAVVQIDCPQDTIIIKLNAELNKTYLWYGAESDRTHYAANQVAQDENAQKSSLGTASSRATAKAGGGYSNRNRDLVDTLAEDREILKKVKAEELPDELKSVQPEKREAYIRQMAERRAGIQKQIQQLSTERDAYVAKEEKRMADKSIGATYGDAVVQAIRDQLAKSGFENADGSERAN
jgi:hypothetical protein